MRLSCQSDLSDLVGICLLAPHRYRVFVVYFLVHEEGVYDVVLLRLRERKFLQFFNQLA